MLCIFYMDTEYLKQVLSFVKYKKIRQRAAQAIIYNTFWRTICIFIYLNKKLMFPLLLQCCRARVKQMSSSCHTWNTTVMFLSRYCHISVICVSRCAFFTPVTMLQLRCSCRVDSDMLFSRCTCHTIVTVLLSRCP
jgi:hypothetical protein